MQYLREVQETALRHGLDPALVAAICRKESSWNTWAIRFEPGYRWLWPSSTSVAAPSGVSKDTEVNQQSTSWGLMQVMGAVARERGLVEPFCSSLCDPLVGLEYGCKHLAKLKQRFPEMQDYVSAYNAGRPTRTNFKYYVQPVLSFYETYKVSFK